MAWRQHDNMGLAGGSELRRGRFLNRISSSSPLFDAPPCELNGVSVLPVVTMATVSAATRGERVVHSASSPQGQPQAPRVGLWLDGQILTLFLRRCLTLRVQRVAHHCQFSGLPVKIMQYLDCSFQIPPRSM